jgi:Pectinacetylesterase
MRLLRNLILTVLATTLVTSIAPATLADSGQGHKGLSSAAMQELRDVGLDKYLGQFTPASSTDVGDGWTKHQFDTDGGNGPICIAGTPFSAFTRMGDPKKLLIFEQGGGACWQDFYFCNILAESQEPPAPPVGIWDFNSPDNPFADYSIVYMPYCDGSVHSGDNDVVDANFPFGPVRFHRGLRNQSAGMDIALATFPEAKRITVAGSSAGGVGVAGNAPFLVRMLYGNKPKLTVFNDAGPVATNLSENAAIAARLADWKFDQFYPASCTACDPFGQPTAVIDWRLANDSRIREAFYSTDGDATNRFFMNVPTQELYRNLLLSEHGALNASHPKRYRSFIVSGDSSHTALQTPLFYSQEVNGTTLNDWTEAFIKNDKDVWVELIQDFVPLP